MSERESESERKRGQRGRRRASRRDNDCGADCARNRTANISIPPPPRETTFGGLACVIFLSAEITHWPGVRECVRTLDHTRKRMYKRVGESLVVRPSMS